MRFDEFIKSLSDSEIECYAASVGTSVNYLVSHLVPARKVPRKELMVKLAEAGSPHISKQDVLAHFYPEMFGIAA